MNLTTTRDEVSTKKLRRDKEDWDILSSREKDSSTDQILSCDKVYEDHKHLVIKGIPGVGKTTILKYFCFRAFNDDKYALFVPCNTLPEIKQ